MTFAHYRPPYRLRNFAMPKNGTGYKPGRLVDLAGDQCRYVLDESYVMCGAKVSGPRSSWCDRHQRGEVVPHPPAA